MVSDNGLKLWPRSDFVVLVDALQRGRLSAFLEADLGGPEPMGVIEPLRAGDSPTAGEDIVVSRELRGRRGCGVARCELVRRPNWGCGRLLPKLGVRLFDLAFGVMGSMPKPDMMTDEGGELPGVLIPLPKLDWSFDNMLEMESRRCWLLRSA